MKRAYIRTSDVAIPEASTINLSSDLSDIDRPDIAVVTDESLASPVVSEYIKDLRFMEDILTVVIGETTDSNAENPVPAGCNGEIRLLTRGQEYKLQRKFVDSLIKREDKIKTVQYKDADQVEQTKVNKIPALKYPISIIADPAGSIGSRWFQHQCRNAW